MRDRAELDRRTREVELTQGVQGKQRARILALEQTLKEASEWVHCADDQGCNPFKKCQCGAVRLAERCREVLLGSASEALSAQLEKERERQARYDQLYAEWRMKNDACNLAYGVTIPELKKSEARLLRVVRKIDQALQEIPKPPQKKRKKS